MAPFMAPLRTSVVGWSSVAHISYIYLAVWDGCFDFGPCLRRGKQEAWGDGLTTSDMGLGTFSSPVPSRWL